MRRFIRHPTDIPIEYELGDIVSDSDRFLNDIGEGGLSFQSIVSMKHGDVVMIRIPIRSPMFEEKGIVVWCRKRGDLYDIGVRFMDDSSDFRLRMIEQVCYIEHYKTEVLEEEGRELTGAEAATEWIRKFAGDFPS